MIRAWWARFTVGGVLHERLVVAPDALAAANRVQDVTGASGVEIRAEPQHKHPIVGIGE